MTTTAQLDKRLTTVEDKQAVDEANIASITARVTALETATTSLTTRVTALEAGSGGTPLAPIIDSVTVIPQSAPTGTLRTITITAHDPNNLALTYTCLVGTQSATATSSSSVFTFMASIAGVATATVRNSGGLSASASAPISIMASPPTGTLTATIALPTQTVIFAMVDGVNMGNYVAPTAGFTQQCVRVHNVALPNFFVDFRPDLTGRTEVVFWNGECAGNVPSGFTRDLPGYTATIKDTAGVTLHTEVIRSHGWGSRWRWQSAKRPVIRTAAQVFSDGFLPHMSAAAARVTGYSGVIVPPPPPPVGTYSTFMAIDAIGNNSKLGLVCDIDRGGDRPELGLITEWQADWLVRGTPSSLSAMIEQAEMCAGDWGWFIPDSVTGASVNYKSDDAHYHMYTNQNGYDASWYLIKYGNRNSWGHTGDSHTPSIFYLPWVLTEDPYFIEAQQFFVQAATGITAYHRDSVFIPVGTRVVCSYPNEQRCMGWGIRNLAAAWRMTPAAPPSWLLPQSYYADVSADYSAVCNYYYNTSSLPRHAVFHTISGDPYFQAFEQAYVIQAIGLADLVGMPTGAHPSWKTHLDFYFGFIDGITSATSGWNHQCPQPHDVLAADLDALPSPSWAAAWAMWQPLMQVTWGATFPNAPSPGNQQGGSQSNCSHITAACAVAKSRGVLPATASKAWMDTFVNYNYPNNADASMGIPFVARCGFDGT